MSFSSLCISEPRLEDISISSALSSSTPFISISARIVTRGISTSLNRLHSSSLRSSCSSDSLSLRVMSESLQTSSPTCSMGRRAGDTCLAPLPVRSASSRASIPSRLNASDLSLSDFSPSR